MPPTPPDLEALENCVDLIRLCLIAEIWATPSRAVDGFGPLYEYERLAVERIGEGRQ